jgi:hypothetical protein
MADAMTNTHASEVHYSGADNVVRLDQPGDISYEGSLQELTWYQHFAQATDVEDFARRVRNSIQCLGFSDFSYHRVECQSTADACMITTPRRLSEYYDGEGAWQYDPVLLHCAAKAQPIYRSVVNSYIEQAPFENEAFERILKLRDYTAELGYFDYYHRPLQTTNGNGNAVLSITARNVPVDQFHKNVAEQSANIDLLTRVIDYVGTLKFPQYFMNQNESTEVVISPRPLILLHVLAKHDLTVQQAADQLCISISTTHKHIAALKQSFGVKTIWGALFKAIKAGLIK